MTSLTSTQLVYIWTLTGFLLTWMIVFAVLALLPGIKIRRNVEAEEFTSPSMHVVQTPAPSMLRVLATPPIALPSSQMEVASYESPMMAD